jgi:hypothetical protein
MELIMATAKTAEIEFKFLIKKEQIDDVKAYIEHCGTAQRGFALAAQAAASNAVASSRGND